MRTIFGTASFTSKAAAIRYYRAYGETTSDVERKIELAEIFIGKPPINEGECLILVDNGTRYAIVVSRRPKPYLDMQGE